VDAASAIMRLGCWFVPVYAMEAAKEETEGHTSGPRFECVALPLDLGVDVQS
jgi:hypothetical protein